MILGTILIFSYILIVFLIGAKVVIDYNLRRLVKANFWCNVGIFSLLSVITLAILFEFYIE